MIILKLLLRSLIYIAAIAIADSIDEEDEWENTKRNVSNYILSENITPMHYIVQFQFNPMFTMFFYGECEIIIYVNDKTHYIGFHVLFWMRISKWELKEINNRVIREAKQDYYFDRSIDDDDIILLHLDDVLFRGVYILYIQFSIPIEFVTDTFATLNKGRYGTERSTEEWLIITGVQTKQQQILPFWNKPELRITFDISIKHDRSYKVLSNMPIRESKLLENNMMLTYFYKSFFTISNVILMESSFHRITNLDNTTSIWCRSKLIPHMKFALHVAENVTMYLEKNWYNSKKVLEKALLFIERKVDHVAFSDLKDEIKQTLGFVFYRETDIIYDDELDPVARKMRIARLIARGMTQKYIGNLLNPSYCFHQWLNEGFIMYLQEYILEKALPNSRMMDWFIVQVQHALLDLNSYIVINSAVEYNTYPGNYYSSLSHIKGSIIWRMLERTLPSNIFFMGINKYLNLFSDRKATTSDHLWNAMQSIMIELNFNYKLNIKSIMESWAMQRSFPVLNVMRDYSKNVVNISVQFNNTLDEKQYYIPVTYTTELNPNFTKTWTNVWLTPSQSQIEFFLDKNQWIIFNLQQAGPYRVYYDTENWRKIARYLNSEKYTNIHVLNRAQIIDDAFYFVMKKNLDFLLFWKLANYLSRERDYIAWYPMIKVFEFLSRLIPLLKFYPYLKFKFMVQNIPLTMWNSYENSADDHTTYLKQELAKWKCIIDDPFCKTLANRTLEWHLLNTKKNKLLPGWKRWTYCNGLKMADRGIWEKVFQYYMKETDHIILECLACTENSEIIINYLEIKLPQILKKLWYQPYRPNEQDFALNANIFLFTLARNTKYMLKDLLNNFEKINHREVNHIVTLIVMINNVYFKDQLDEISNFVKHEIEASIPILDIRSIIIPDVEHKIETRWLEIQKQIEHVESLCCTQSEN
ncbi:aminopeptidase N [Camponotus floridanus]|uniref:aminopeptidase N n=1 Tax=Camponotus floridanus TaxID=104421 RepID=UPI000DC6A253|nr:aminopeptidase N [Camponotus floridanus]